jgi:L-alanine-DL-glutamate epimerase-like enolase superfamily enzyme
MPNTPVEAGREAQKWAAQGFTAVKLGWGGFGRSLANDVALVEAARSAVGEGVELMFDIGLVWDASTAIHQVRRMEPFRPYWIEEPLPPDDLAAYRRLADSVDTRIAAGEQSVTRWDFVELLEQGRVDVIQPDLAHAGGITETRRIAELARLRDVLTVPHAFKTGILKAATLHFLAALPEAPFLEFCVWDSPLAHDLTEPRFWIERDGTVAVPQGPGLGITLNEEVVERYRVA